MSDEEKLYGICLGCGRSHDPENRRRLIWPMRELEFKDVRTEWSCFYPPTPAGERTLFRDRAVLRRLSASGQ